MSDKYKGFVEKINQKKGNGAKGPWVLYSALLIDKEGEKVGWFNFGFDAPACKEGDYVQLTAEFNDKYKNYEVSKTQVSKNPPAKPAAKDAPKKGGGGYQKDPNVQAQIAYQAARNSAISTIELLLANGGLKLRKGDSKAIVAANFDIIMAAIDKVTVEFFRDVIAEGFEDTLRKLETVSDSGDIDTSGDGDLPDSDDDEDNGFDEADDMDDGDDDDDFE
jgi:hypothetical protein